MGHSELVFDVEVVRESDPELLPLDIQMWAERRLSTPEDSWRDRLALHPVTGVPICVAGVYLDADLEPTQAFVLSVIPRGAGNTYSDADLERFMGDHSGGHWYKRTLTVFGGTPCEREEEVRVYECWTERDLLEMWWRLAGRERVKRLVGFSSRGYDLPMLSIRSTVNGVDLSRNPVSPPYNHSEHLDIYQALRFGGQAFSFSAPLHAWCYLYGIPSPKGAMDGSDVGEAWIYGATMDVVGGYCLTDVYATAALRKAAAPLLSYF